MTYKVLRTRYNLIQENEVQRKHKVQGDEVHGNNVQENRKQGKYGTRYGFERRSVCILTVPFTSRASSTSIPLILGQIPMNTMSAAVTEFASPLIMVRLDLDLVPNGCCDTHSASSAQPEMRVEKTNAGYISCICQVTESLSFSVPLSSLQRDS